MLVDEVEFRVDWPPASPMTGTGQPLLDDTLGRLAIRIGPDVATRFRTDNGQEGDQLLIPTYGLAEWIAANWWPLLFEPPKREDFEDDVEYRARHWLGAARQGFALPDLWLCPAGGKLEIIGSAAQLRFARLSFLVEIGEAVVETAVTREALGKFVDGVIARLNARGRPASPLHDMWRAVRETAPETEDYCRLIGALGLSPYEDDHPEIDRVLDRLCDSLDRLLVTDLCEAADATTFPALAELTLGIAEQLAAAPPAELGHLLAVDLPPDHERYAWQWGLAAAHQVRRKFHISNADPQGGQQFLTALGLDQVRPLDWRAERVSGGLRRRDDRLQLVVFDELPPQQRFTTARAAFLAWAGSLGDHLVSDAITRDQQASRAFAAEMLAPTAYIRTKSRNRVLSDHGIGEIVQATGAPAGAVRYQAGHAGINVVGSRGWG
jgi:hypothetical protein